MKTVSRGILPPTPQSHNATGSGGVYNVQRHTVLCSMMNRMGALDRGPHRQRGVYLSLPRGQRYFRGTRRHIPAAIHRHETDEDGSSGMLFADFISSASKAKSGVVGDEEMIDELIERTSGVLKDAADALARVREREENEARNIPGVKKKSDSSGGGVVRYSNPRFVAKGPSVAPRAGIDDGDHLKGSSPGLDGWFRGKVDAGPLMEKKKSSQATGLAFKEKEDAVPESFVFSAPMAPEESVKGSRDVFPEHLALRFHSDVFGQSVASESQEMHMEQDKAVQSTTTSGEEFGENGYWYRWTEVSGENESGSVVWTEKWWEISDWSGMKELGAEKYGMNDNGDAWRETWTEKITIDAITRKPMVSRDAHKWARAPNNQEWEEKWSEMYWSGGKTEKWADKWGKDGNDVWHETWGENYDGCGGCVKWTDRWAESPNPDDMNTINKWGDKWREEFKDGQGEKTGETWQETLYQSGLGDPHKYQRWWGERHVGDGNVHKFGNSTTGEHWDVVEQMDTYYNPIPHFGYDLALSHSPQLHNVPILPRDDILDLDFE